MINGAHSSQTPSEGAAQCAELARSGKVRLYFEVYFFFIDTSGLCSQFGLEDMDTLALNAPFFSVASPFLSPKERR